MKATIKSVDSSKKILQKLNRDFVEFVRGITLKDVFISLLFPIIITALMFLPSNIKELLSLHIHNPKWWQFFTHAFIHECFDHLWHNLQGYFIFGIVIFIFANKIKEKKNLFLLFLFILISLPLINSTIETLIYPIFLPTLKISQGSSGIISAILGFLPMFWIYYLSIKQKVELINVNFFNIAISYMGLLFAIVYYPIHKSMLAILLISSVIVFFSFLYRKNFKLIFKGVIKELKDNVIFYSLTILSPILFMVAPLLLFPVRIIQEDSLVNFFTHCIGLLYGVIVSFTFLKFRAIRLNFSQAGARLK